MIKNTFFFLFFFLFFITTIIAQKRDTTSTFTNSATINIGYGYEDINNISSAVTTVEREWFNPGINITPVELIIGKASGVLVTRESGTPGSAYEVTIRGKSTLLFTNGDPLYVVDGIPLSSGPIDGMRNPLNFINPEDIKSFTILKDAGAQAIYGGRASNGVILINTKTGTLGQPLRINYTGKISIGLSKKRDVLPADEFRSLVSTKYSGNPDVISLLGNSNTDWQDNIFKDAKGQDHLLCITGGIKKLPYRVSLGYSGQDGVLKTDKLNRFTAMLNLNPRFFKDHLGIGFGLKAMHTTNHFANPEAIPTAIAFDPTQSVYDPDNKYSGYFYWKYASGKPVIFAPDNPVAMLDFTDNSSKVTRLFLQFNVDYKFHFLPELKIAFHYAYDQTKSDRNKFINNYIPPEYYPVGTNGRHNTFGQKKGTSLYEGLLAYDKSFQKINSVLDVVLGFSNQSFRDKQEYKFANLDGSQVIKEGNVQSDNNLVSIFVRVNFSLKRKYLIGLTYRRDGYSMYEKENRHGNFPAISLGWNIHNEAFLSRSGTVSTLRLRVSYGNNGNMFIPFEPFYFIGSTYSIDPKLKPETTTGLNAGLDYGFLNDRIYGSIDIYKRHTTGAISFVHVPTGTNPANKLLTNYGDIENSGIEFSLVARAIFTKNTTWDIGLTASMNNNRITEITYMDGSAYPGLPAGDITGGIGNTIQIQSQGHPVNSFFVYGQVYDANGNPVEGVYVDRNNDNIIDNRDKYFYNTPYPKVFMSLYSMLKVKNWEFSFLGTLRIGNYVYNNIDSYHAVYDMISPMELYLNSVTPDINHSRFEHHQYFSDYYVQDASYFRLNNLMAGYDFKNLMKGKWGFRLYATVQNLFTVSNYKGPEPEIRNGIDYNTYASPKIFMMGLSASFN